MSNQSVADPYHSRQQAEWEIVPRVDPCVWSEIKPGQRGIENELTDDQLSAYEEVGYHHSPHLISTGEASELLSEANRLAEAAAGKPRPGVVTEPGSSVVRSLFRLHRNNQKIMELAKDPRLVNIAKQVLGGEVYVHQSRINFKPAFDGKEFFWHSDFETWHVEDGMPRMRAVSVSVGLTESNEFNGPLVVIPGSHRSFVRCVGATPENHYKDSLKKQEYGVPSREAMRQLVLKHGMVAPKGEPGSAMFFECNLMHGSSGNLSPFPRTNFFIVYSSVENAVESPFGGTPSRPEYLAEREVIPVEELTLDIE